MTAFAKAYVWAVCAFLLGTEVVEIIAERADGNYTSLFVRAAGVGVGLCGLGGFWLWQRHLGRTHAALVAKSPRCAECDELGIENHDLVIGAGIDACDLHWRRGVGSRLVALEDLAGISQRQVTFDLRPFPRSPSGDQAA